jgi:hypothetical protein
MHWTRSEAAEQIANFLEGKGGNWDWDDFISLRCDDPFIEEIRKRCVSLPDRYPPAGKGYCNEYGLRELEEMLNLLRTSP